MTQITFKIVRIFSKKKQIDCTEAVIKLKGLSKTISKIDLPSEQDHQALLASGSLQTDKPQVYQEIDRFLRNIYYIDLVEDPLYDPNKSEPTEKPVYTSTTSHQIQYPVEQTHKSPKVEV
ncbi:hypothetical protein ACTFIZ_010355 [Dictyostelium cf. discoideum]